MQILFCIMWSAYVVIYMFSLICLTTYNLRCAWLSGSTSPVAPAGRSRIHLSHWRSRAHSQKRRHVLSIPGLSTLLRPSLMPPSLSTGVRKRKILWVDSPPPTPTDRGPWNPNFCSNLSSLSSCNTSSVFHSIRLKTYLLHKSFPRYFSDPLWTAFTEFGLELDLMCRV